VRLVAATLAALSLAGPAAAAAPRFAVYDLQHDLAHASRNAFGDVAARPSGALAGHGTLVRCGGWCRFGDGWLAFAGRPRLGAVDVASVRAGFSRRLGWSVRVRLSPAGRREWTGFAAAARVAARRHGVPDVLVVVAGGQVAAAPLSSQVFAADGVLTLTGFSGAAARALVRLLR
jgi:hypothetical protein